MPEPILLSSQIVIAIAFGTGVVAGAGLLWLFQRLTGNEGRKYNDKRIDEMAQLQHRMVEQMVELRGALVKK